MNLFNLQLAIGFTCRVHCYERGREEFRAPHAENAVNCVQNFKRLKPLRAAIAILCICHYPDNVRTAASNVTI